MPAQPRGTVPTIISTTFAYLPDEASNESSGSGSVLLVVPVCGSDDDSVVTDVVTVVANDLDLGCGNHTESLVTVGVAKGNDCSRLAHVLRGSKLRRGWDANLVE
jgi:hypothetical protein